MSELPIALTLVIGVLFGAGAYLVMALNTLRLVLGVLLLSQAVNLLIFVAGKTTWGESPIISASESTLQSAVEPLTQALILTAIVISFAATTFLVVLVRESFVRLGKDNSDAMREAEQ